MTGLLAVVAGGVAALLLTGPGTWVQLALPGQAR
jgi:hypothetical protein